MANTPNYNLYKPSQTDSEQVDITLSDNFEKIDTEIKNRQNEIEAHASSTAAHSSKSITHGDGSVNDAFLEVNQTVNEIDIRVTETANEAKTIAAETQAQFDRVVAEAGSNNPEVVQARDIEVNLNARLNKIDGKVKSGNTNIFVGKDAGKMTDLNAEDKASTGQYNNIAIGKEALASNTKGWNNLAIGQEALKNNVYGFFNVAIGLEAMHEQVGFDETGANARGARNVAVGTNSLRFNNEGYGNVAIGRNAFHTNVSGFNNTAIGRDALSGSGPEVNGVITNETPKTCSDVVAVGVSALFYNNGNKNTAVGAYAAQNLKNSTGNVAIGHSAMRNLESGLPYFGAPATNNNNVAIGIEAMRDAVSGGDNIAIGSSTLLNTESSGNIAIGPSSLMKQTTGSSNIAIGKNAMVGDNPITGSNNVGVGVNAIGHIIGGSNNTAIGANALYNTQAGGNHQNFNNCTGIGYDSRVSGDNQVQLGNSATTTYAYGAVQSRSDERDKADIRDTQLGLNFINKLRPVDFKWDYRDDYLEVDEETEEIIRYEKDGSRKRSRYHHGLIAQEVRQVMGEIGVDFGGFQDHKVNGGEDVLSIGYEELIGPLIKAVQELSAKVRELETVS